MLSRADGVAGWALRPATRLDAGGGHVSRCVALGVALAARGPVTAVIEKGGESWIGRFRDASLETAAEAELGDRAWVGVVLDDYGMQAGDVARWCKRVAGPVVQIIDHQAPLPGVDLAINATAGRSGSSIGDTPALLGEAYAMLAVPYSGRPKPRIKARIERVLVSIGWIDPEGVTERILAALARTAEPGTKVDVMLSASSPNIARVAAMVDGKPGWQLYRDAKEPWMLLEDADIAISAAGQGLLERLAFGIPTLAMAVAENQEPALAGVINAGAAFDLGRLGKLSEEKMASAFAALAGDAALRARLSVAAQRLVDGRGAERVARHLLAMVSTPSAAKISQ